MLIVGLTGGVASGKTAVSGALKREGAYIIDADQIARELVQPHQPAWDELIRVFGRKILQEDGFIDRKQLAEKIFGDPEQRKVLNQILHPRIEEEMDRRTKEIEQKDPHAIVVIDAPLLVELGAHRKVDTLVVVTSTPGQQIERLKERDGRSADEAEGIFTAQMPVEEKAKLADIVIRNEGSIEELERKTRGVFQQLKKRLLQKNKTH
jgi:dephospho-CoA kinase